MTDRCTGCVYCYRLRRPMHVPKRWKKRTISNVEQWQKFNDSIGFGRFPEVIQDRIWEMAASIPKKETMIHAAWVARNTNLIVSTVEGQDAYYECIAALPTNHVAWGEVLMFGMIRDSLKRNYTLFNYDWMHLPENCTGPQTTIFGFEGSRVNPFSAFYFTTINRTGWMEKANGYDAWNRRKDGRNYMAFGRYKARTSQTTIKPLAI